jgi:hypothetical protein
LTQKEAVDIIQAALLSDTYIYAVCDFMPRNVVGTRELFDLMVDFVDLDKIETIDFASKFSFVDTVSVDKTSSDYIVLTGKVFRNDNYFLRRVVLFDENDLAVNLNDYSVMFMNKDKEFVEVAVKVFVYVSGFGAQYFGDSFYDYAIRDTKSAYEFVFYIVALERAKVLKGDFNKLDLMQKKVTVDKKTGIIKIDHVEVLKSFTLSSAEASRLEAEVRKVSFAKTGN